MASILLRLDAVFRMAFENLGFPPNAGAVRESDRPDLAPFQCNGAMMAAGILKKRGETANPREIAQAVIDRVKNHADIAPQTIIIDYGGANVAKPMHVGHLRSAVIGECLKRLLRFRGHRVIGDVHLGDWGLQMGHLITELSDEQPDLPYFDAGKTDAYPEVSPVTMEDLARLYPAASQKAKSDPARMERSRLATAELQSGRPGYRALLEHFIAVSIKALKQGYGNSGHDRGFESFSYYGRRRGGVDYPC